MRSILSTCVAGAAAAGLFYSFGIAAPRERVRTLDAELADVSARVGTASRAIAEVRDLERKCSHIRARLAQRGQLTSSPLLWFPEQMQSYFSRFGFENVAPRVNTSMEVAGLAGYQRTFWAVTLPLRGAASEVDRVLMAASELEAADPHVRVQTVSISTDAQALGGRCATVNASVLTRQF